MRPRVWTMILAGVVALGDLLGAGVGGAKAQVVVVNPGAWASTPARATRPFYRAFPVGRYVYGRRGFYGRRFYRSFYARPGYSYWRW